MNNRQEFLPMGSVTGVGSLPMTDAENAVMFVAEFCPRVPFWPQLPQRAAPERMTEQALLPFRDLLHPCPGAVGYHIQPGAERELTRRLDDAAAELDAERAAGFFAFERALTAGAFPQALALKGQIVGPITLAAQLFADGRPLLAARGADIARDLEVFRAVAWYVTRLALWQIDRLQRWRLPVVLVLDEPCLSLAAGQRSVMASHIPPVLKESFTMLRAAGAVAGVHCCARPPASLVCRAHPDLVSFDAHQGLEEFFTEPDMQAFMRNGGLVAFGLIPTWPDLSEFHPLTLLSRWLESAVACGDIAGLAQRSLFTATCGLGLLSEQATRRSFQLGELLAAGAASLIRRASGHAHAPPPREPITGGRRMSISCRRPYDTPSQHSRHHPVFTSANPRSHCRVPGPAAQPVDRQATGDRPARAIRDHRRAAAAVRHAGGHVGHGPER
jgi:hypothetical protein